MILNTKYIDNTWCAMVWSIELLSDIVVIILVYISSNIPLPVSWVKERALRPVYSLIMAFITYVCKHVFIYRSETLLYERYSVLTYL